MEGKLIKRTNKAELLRLPDGSILKRYFTNNAVDRVMQDQRSLQYIHENFGQVCYNGWGYRVVKPLWVSTDRKSLCLEFVSGYVLSEIPRSKAKEAEYHCGVWMALYHNKVLDGNIEGLIYTDFGVHNIIIDFDQKRVTAIDPGAIWGRSAYVYEDLIIHVYSVLVVLVAKRRAPFSAVISFLAGYTSVNKAKLNLYIYFKSLCREFRRRLSEYAAESLGNCLQFLLLTGFLLPFFVFFVPGHLYLRRPH